MKFNHIKKAFVAILIGVTLIGVATAFKPTNSVEAAWSCSALWSGRGTMTCLLEQSGNVGLVTTSVSHTGVGRLRSLGTIRLNSNNGWLGEDRMYAGTNATSVTARTTGFLAGRTLQGNHQWIANTTFARNTQLRRN